jgi:UDP-N-acetylmuramate dehydrogenase
VSSSNDRIFRAFKGFFGEAVRSEEPLKKHCTFHIGGPAEFFAVVNTAINLSHALAFCTDEGVPVTVIGWGSNILFPDDGVEGLVLKFAADTIRFDDEIVNVQAGALLPALAGTAAANGLSGLEFACGIPGTVGGAVIMNAGVKHECIGDLVEKISGFTSDGGKLSLGREQLVFNYRSSNLGKDGQVITDVMIKLKHENPAKIRKKMADFTEKRKSTQPLEYPSAGSIFKNPIDTPAWKLIEKAGCRGLRIGDAQVSEKHTNFIINLGDAKAYDVKKLMETVRERVKRMSGILLELEVIDMSGKSRHSGEST